MENDISRTSIVILVVLTVIISLLGMWTVVTSTPEIGESATGSTDTGTVSLTIKPPVQHTSLATGQVSLRIEQEG